MTTWFHTAILATSLAGTLAIGLASAAILRRRQHSGRTEDRPSPGRSRLAF